MKIMSARDAKNRFGEFLDMSRREPVVVTKNNRPVGIMISIEDAADTILPEFLMDKEPGYEEWLVAKVKHTMELTDTGVTPSHEHEEAMSLLRNRLAARMASKTGPA